MVGYLDLLFQTNDSFYSIAFSDIQFFKILSNVFKGIFSILDQNLDHRYFENICMKLKEWRVLYRHAVLFDM